VREIGILIWVGLLIIGVVGSMVSSLRRQPQAVREPPPGAPASQPAWLERMVAQLRQEGTPVAPRPPVPPPARKPPPPAPATDHPFPPAPRARLARLFATRRDLVRGVIAAEVLGKPRAFGDETFRY